MNDDRVDSGIDQQRLQGAQRSLEPAPGVHVCLAQGHAKTGARQHGLHRPHVLERSRGEIGGVARRLAAPRWIAAIGRARVCE